MKKYAIPLLMITLLLALGACSNDLATDPVDPTNADKRPPVIADPPDTDDFFLRQLYNTYLWTQWAVIDVELDRTGDTKVTDPALWDGYSVYVTVGEGIVPPDEQRMGILTLFLPAKPAAGGTLDIPRNCLIYKTSGAHLFKDVKLAIPLVPWVDSSEYGSDFRSYSLNRNTDGSVDRVDEVEVFLGEGPGEKADTLYLDVPIGFGDFSGVDDEEDDETRRSLESDIGSSK